MFWNLKEKGLDHTAWKTGFGKGYRPEVRRLAYDDVRYCLVCGIARWVLLLDVCYCLMCGIAWCVVLCDVWYCVICGIAWCVLLHYVCYCLMCSIAWCVVLFDVWYCLMCVIAWCVLLLDVWYCLMCVTAWCVLLLDVWYCSGAFIHDHFFTTLINSVLFATVPHTCPMFSMWKAHFAVVLTAFYGLPVLLYRILKYLHICPPNCSRQYGHFGLRKLLLSNFSDSLFLQCLCLRTASFVL